MAVTSHADEIAPLEENEEGELELRGKGWHRLFDAWYFLRDLPRAWPWIRPYKKLALISSVMAFSGALTGLLTPWPVAIVIDSILGHKPLPSLLGPLDTLSQNTLLIIASLGVFIVAFLQHAVTIVDNYVNTKLDQRMVLDFRSDLFQHAQRLSLSFHDKTLSSKLMYQVNQQADSVGAVTVTIPPLVQSMLMLALMFFIAFRIDHELALVALAVVPLIYYSAGTYAKRIEPELRRVRGLEMQALSIVHEAMAMVRVIMAFRREHYEASRYREQGENAVDARVRLTVKQTAYSLLINTLTALGTGLVLYIGAKNVMAGDLTIGELVVILGYVAAIYEPLAQISESMTHLQQSFVGFRSALRLLDTDPEIKEIDDPVEVRRARGAVTYEDVSFTYAGRESTLKHISLAAEPGQRVAIVGPTGAGKSTLVSLLPRFYDPSEGRVELDGIDIRSLSLDSLRTQMSIVLQEPLLFTFSIADNIRYGRLDATDEDVVRAAEAANAHEFISRLPDGYETQIGQRGARLSGGERQRVTIARAFLKDAPILILDEPTSSVDSKTEQAILEALERLMLGRTTFIIAHRLSTVRNADVIVVVLDGEIVERGTHDELAAAHGAYAQLWQAQTGDGGRGGIRGWAAARKAWGSADGTPPMSILDAAKRKRVELAQEANDATRAQARPHP